MIIMLVYWCFLLYTALLNNRLFKQLVKLTEYKNDQKNPFVNRN